jgi:hypothetical protein
MRVFPGIKLINIIIKNSQLVIATKRDGFKQPDGWPKAAFFNDG